MWGNYHCTCISNAKTHDMYNYSARQLLRVEIPNAPFHGFLHQSALDLAGSDKKGLEV